jgi:hypothetical protein
MDRLSQAKALLAALAADERETLTLHGAEVANRYGDAANALEDWISEWLEPALECEGEAQCVEPALPLYTRSARSLEFA